MYREQTDRSANFCLPVHVDKIRSLTDLHPNRQRPKPSFPRLKMPIEYIEKFIRDYRADGEIYDKHCYYQYITSRICPFTWQYLHFTLAHSKGQGQGIAHFDSMSRK